MYRFSLVSFNIAKRGLSQYFNGNARIWQNCRVYNSFLQKPRGYILKRFYSEDDRKVLPPIINYNIKKNEYNEIKHKRQVDIKIKPPQATTIVANDPNYLLKITMAKAKLQREKSQSIENVEETSEESDKEIMLRDVKRLGFNKIQALDAKFVNTYYAAEDLSKKNNATLIVKAPLAKKPKEDLGFDKIEKPNYKAPFNANSKDELYLGAGKKINEQVNYKVPFVAQSKQELEAAFAKKINEKAPFVLNPQNELETSFAKKINEKLNYKAPFVTNSKEELDVANKINEKVNYKAPFVAQTKEELEAGFAKKLNEKLNYKTPFVAKFKEEMDVAKKVNEKVNYRAPFVANSMEDFDFSQKNNAPLVANSKEELGVGKQINEKANYKTPFVANSKEGLDLGVGTKFNEKASYANPKEELGVGKRINEKANYAAPFVANPKEELGVGKRMNEKANYKALVANSNEEANSKSTLVKNSWEGMELGVGKKLNEKGNYKPALIANSKEELDLSVGNVLNKKTVAKNSWEDLDLGFGKTKPAIVKNSKEEKNIIVAKTVEEIQNPMGRLLGGSIDMNTSPQMGEASTTQMKADAQKSTLKIGYLNNVLEKELNETSGKSSDDSSGQQSWRNMKYSFVLLGASWSVALGYLFYVFASPKRDEAGVEIADQFSHLPTMQQFYYRIMHGLDEYRKMINEPSRDKLLPDILKAPYFQPPYTLVLELTDVLVHPEWTYSTGWRFKKRPGVDQFLELLYSRFEVVVYTAELGMTVFPILEALDSHNYITYKLVRDATNFIGGHHVKDLDKLNRDLSKVIVIDWNPDSTQMHKDNLFKIPKWDGKDDDRTLFDLIGFLTAISEWEVDDVRAVLSYYSQFESPLAKFKQRQMEILEAVN